MSDEFDFDKALKALQSGNAITGAWPLMKVVLTANSVASAPPRL